MRLREAEENGDRDIARIQQRTFYPATVSFGFEAPIQSFMDMQQLSKFIALKPVVREALT